MNFVSEVGEMQGGVVPDPEKPLTFESLVEQYKDQAIRACRTKGWDERMWRSLAEVWADVDMDIFRTILTSRPGVTSKQILQEFCSIPPSV